MKTVGIGVDIIDNKRFKKLIKDKKFINRIFSKKEISASKKKLIILNCFFQFLMKKITQLLLQLFKKFNDF